MGFAKTSPAVELRSGSVAWFALAASRAVVSQAAAWTAGFAEGAEPIAVDSIVLAAAAVAVSAVLPATASAAASASALASVVVATAAVATAAVAIAAIAAAAAASGSNHPSASCPTHYPSNSRCPAALQPGKKIPTKHAAATLNSTHLLLSPGCCIEVETSFKPEIGKSIGRIKTLQSH